MTPEVITNFLAQRDAHADFARCRSYLQDALDLAGGTHTMEDIVAGIQLGHFHFWPGRQSAAITEVHQFPRARFLNIFLAGGELHELLEMEPFFASWGAHLGCYRVTLTGRPGWERALKSKGWQRVAVVLFRPIEQISIH